MASGTIKKQKITMGTFEIALPANSLVEVKANTIISGNLPTSDFRYCIFSCISFSSGFPENLTIACDGNHLYIKSSSANSSVNIRWWDLVSL